MLFCSAALCAHGLFWLLIALVVFQIQKRRSTLSKIPAPREGEKNIVLLHPCKAVVFHCGCNSAA